MNEKFFPNISQNFRKIFMNKLLQSFYNFNLRSYCETRYFFLMKLKVKIKFIVDDYLLDGKIAARKITVKT